MGCGSFVAGIPPAYAGKRWETISCKQESLWFVWNCGKNSFPLDIISNEGNGQRGEDLLFLASGGGVGVFSLATDALLAYTRGNKHQHELRLLSHAAAFRQAQPLHVNAREHRIRKGKTVTLEFSHYQIGNEYWLQ